MKHSILIHALLLLVTSMIDSYDRQSSNVQSTMDEIEKDSSKMVMYMADDINVEQISR